MNGSTALKNHEWEALKAAMLKRMSTYDIPEEELVAIQIVWPEGIQGSSTILPGCVKLALQGIRLRGLTCSNQRIRRSEVSYNGLPLVFMSPVDPITHEREMQERKAVYILDLVGTGISR